MTYFQTNYYIAHQLSVESTDFGGDGTVIEKNEYIRHGIRNKNVMQAENEESLIKT